MKYPPDQLATYIDLRWQRYPKMCAAETDDLAERLMDDPLKEIQYLVTYEPSSIKFRFPIGTPYIRYDTVHKSSKMKKWTPVSKDYGLDDIYRLNHIMEDGSKVCIFAGQGINPDQFLDIYPESQLVIFFLDTEDD